MNGEFGVKCLDYTRLTKKTHNLSYLISNKMFAHNSATGHTISQDRHTHRHTGTGHMHAYTNTMHMHLINESLQFTTIKLILKI